MHFLLTGVLQLKPYGRRKFRKYIETIFKAQKYFFDFLKGCLIQKFPYAKRFLIFDKKLKEMSPLLAQDPSFLRQKIPFFNLFLPLTQEL